MTYLIALECDFFPTMTIFCNGTEVAEGNVFRGVCLLVILSSGIGYLWLYVLSRYISGVRFLLWIGTWCGGWGRVLRCVNFCEFQGDPKLN